MQSKAAGEELALLYSLVVSCTRVGVNPVEYLTDVLGRIDKTADQHFVDLLPDRWKPADSSEPTIFDACRAERHRDLPRRATPVRLRGNCGTLGRLRASNFLLTDFARGRSERATRCDDRREAAAQVAAFAPASVTRARAALAHTAP